jgi:hypothetical protein
MILMTFAYLKYKNKSICHVASFVEPVSRAYRVEPAYNDIGLCDTSSIAFGILRYRSIPHC